MKATGTVIYVVMSVLLLSSCGSSDSEEPRGDYGCEGQFYSPTESCDLFSSGLLAVSKDDQWGYIDASGETVIDYNYNEASAFYGTTAIVKEDEAYYLIDKEGNHVTEGHDSLRRDPETGDVIYKEGRKYGLMDFDGDKLTDASYGAIHDSSEGLFGVKSNAKSGFIDTQGDIVIERQYGDIGKFSHDLAPAEKDGAFGYIDKDGQWVIEPSYEEARAFDHYERARVQLEDEEQLIDLSGETVLSASEIMTSGGPLYGAKDDDAMRLYDHDGNVFTDDEFTGIFEIQGYGVQVETEESELNILFDEEGNKVAEEPLWIPGTMDTVIAGGEPDDPSNVVLVETRDDYVDMKYPEQTHRFEVEEIMPMLNQDHVMFYEDDKAGLMDFEGERIIEPDYDELLLHDDDYIIFIDEGKNGVIDMEGNEIAPAQYSEMNTSLNIFEFND